MDIKEKIDEKRQQLSYKVQAKIKEYLHIQGIGRRTNGITEELTFRVMDVFTMSLWDEIVPLIESEIQSRLSFMVDEEKNKCKECQAWHDDALDWRESEIAKAVIADRIKTGMASIKP